MNIINQYFPDLNLFHIIKFMFFYIADALILKFIYIYHNLFILLQISNTLFFVIKLNLIIFLFLWARAALPRYRYDQLMRLGWKVFLPISLGFVILTAGILYAFDGLPL